MPVYLIDTENANNVWRDVMYCVKPEDSVYLFYTENTPDLHMSSMEFLSECRADVHYVSCFRNSASGDNALDFQLVSWLGYLAAQSAAMGRPEIYFIVSCDGGFDAVVNFWRARNILIQRLVPDLNKFQNLKPGPMITCDPTLPQPPAAIKPNFSRIVGYAKQFSRVLCSTLYYDFRFEIAEIYTGLKDIPMPNDRFVLSFRNALAKRFGVGNNLYALLKPVLQAIADVEAAEKAGASMPERENPPVVVVENASKFAHLTGIEEEVPPAAPVPAPKSEPTAAPDMKALSAVFHGSQHMQSMEKSLKKQLSAGLKSCSRDIVLMMMASYDKDLGVWRENYRKKVTATGQFDINALPSMASTIILSYWPKSERAKLAGLKATAKL